MARMHTTPRFPTGTRVLKRFPGYAEPFGGEIDAFLPDSGFYHVRYDDGDSEEMTEDDVDRHHAGGPRKPKKRPKVVTTPPPAPLSPRGKPAGKQDAKKPRTKMLLLSTSAKKGKARAIVEEEGDDAEDAALADGEHEEGGQEEEEGEEGEEQGEPMQEEPKVVTSPDAIHKLVGQRVCKRQAEGESTIVSGTVSSYFPATKMYRVVYSNGTTDDMTYREVVDSIPLSSTGAAKSNKRKPTDAGSTKPSIGAGVPSQSPKKRKLAETQKANEAATSDENVNNENTADVGDDQEKRSNGTDADSAMTMPQVDKDRFVWNRANAYDTVRAVLYTVVSTTNEASEPLQVLEQTDLKAKAALKVFVERGGLVTLEERLGSWCKNKETEPGVLAILKVLAVLPGVSSDTVLSSKIGQTLNHIRKKKVDRVSPLFDPIVREMASYVIAKWKKEMGMADNKKSSKLGKQTEAKSSLSSVGSKSVKSSNMKMELSTSASAKRSNSASHLRDLIGGPRGSQARNGDLLGNSLNNGRPGSRPLGALHARTARRSTVLIDSIKNRLKTDSEKSSPTTGDRPSLKPDVWTASRVKFGGHSTLVFDNEIEVSQLLIAPVPGAIRPFKPKNGSMKPSPPERQPPKSILLVKMADAEREANAAMLKAGEQAAETEAMSVGSVTLTDSSSITLSTRPSIGDDKQGLNDNVEGSGDRDEDDGEAPLRVAPPSPPRKHDASEDDEDVGDDDPELPPMPDDLVIGDAPSPPSSDIATEQLVETSEFTAMEVDGAGTEQARGTDRAPSPEVSSDSSSAESGEIIEEDESKSHSPPSPSPPPPNSSAPSLSQPSFTSQPDNVSDVPSDSMDVDSVTAEPTETPPS